MRRFTLFTLLYLATGVCLTAIALQHSNRILLLDAGLLYLLSVLSTFSFWHQAALRSQNRLRQQSIWKQKLVAIAPWLVIALSSYTKLIIYFSP